MRLATQSTSRTSPMIGSCPCCFGALEAVKLALGEVSRALAVPLSLSLRAQVGPALDAVRASGRDVLSGLKAALEGLRPVPDAATFRAALVSLDEAIDVSTSGASLRERDILVGLQGALGGLSDALTTLVTELDDAGNQASRRTRPRFRCESVAEQQEVADATIAGGVADRQAAAPEPHRLWMAEGTGR